MNWVIFLMPVLVFRDLFFVKDDIWSTFLPCLKKNITSSKYAGISVQLMMTGGVDF